MATGDKAPSGGSSGGNSFNSLGFDVLASALDSQNSFSPHAGAGLLQGGELKFSDILSGIRAYLGDFKGLGALAVREVGGSFGTSPQTSRALEGLRGLGFNSVMQGRGQVSPGIQGIQGFGGFQGIPGFGANQGVGQGNVQSRPNGLLGLKGL